MDIRKMLKALWFTPGIKGRWGLPVLFEGKPGTAKSAQVEAAAKSLGLHCETLIASLREPSDFLGLPIPTEDAVEYRVGVWARRLMQAKYGVGFLDELNTAAPAVQAALLRMVLDGVVGDLVLPNTIRWVGAQNAVGDAAGGWDLAPPLANRFGHFPWDVPSTDNWCEWLLGCNDGVFMPVAPAKDAKPEKVEKHAKATNVASMAEQEEQAVLDVWIEPFARMRGSVSAFLHRRSELLHKQPQTGSAEASKAWPSPRTWEMAARAATGAEIHDLSEAERETLVAGFIGAGAAGEWFAFSRTMDLPDPADVLDEKVPFKYDPKRQDRVYAILSGCGALISDQKAPKQKDRGAVLWKILNTMVKDAADLCMPAARQLVAGGLAALPEARPVLITMQPLLQAAGIRPR